MKKILTLLLLATLLLTACNTPAPPIDSETNETTVAPTDAESTTPEDIETTTAPNETTTPEDIETTTPEETETTTPNDTDTTVPDDTDTTAPSAIDTEPPTYDKRYAEFLKQYGYSSIDEFENNCYGKPIYPTIGSASDIYVGMTLKELNEVAFPGSLWVWHGYVLGKPYFYYLIDKDGNGVIVVFNPDDTIREFKVFQDLKTDVTEEEFLQVTPGMHLYDAVALIGFPRYGSFTGNSAITWGKRMFSLSIDWETLIVKSNHYAEWLEYEEQNETTTAPNDTDTTVPDDTDTTQPPDIQDDPPTNLPQKVQSVEVTNSDGEIVTISVDMESSEYNAYFPNPICMSKCDFHKSTQNQAVLVVRKHAEKNYEIWLFPERPEPTDADFAKLKYGMSLVEVISVVGIPHQHTNSLAIQYFSDSGIMYGLEFEQDSSVDGEFWIEAAYSNILTEDVTALFRPE